MTQLPSSLAPLRSAVTKITAMIMAHGLTGAVTPASAAQASDETESSTRLPEVRVEENRESLLASPKFTSLLVDTPQSITVITRGLMEEQGATTLRDVLRNSPGITFQAGEGGTPAGDQMTIRGFSARTDLFIDGVRDMGGYARDAFNLEQVEISRGPSSAVSGRGSTGGSINLVSKSPQPESFQRVSAAVGTDDYGRATVDVNQPLAGDSQAGLRLNAMWQDSGVPGRDVVENKSWGVAPSFAFTLGAPTRVVLSYQRLEQDNVPDYGIPRQTLEYVPPVPFSNFYGLKERDYERIDQDLGTLSIEHSSQEGLTLRNLTRVGRTYRDSVITAPRFVSGSDSIIRRTDWKSRDQTDEILANHTNVSLRLGSGTIAHELNAGLELSREKSINYTRVEDPATVLPETDVYAPNPDDAYTGNISRNGAYVEGIGDTVAAYLFDTIHLGARWQFNAGARFDTFDAEQETVDADGIATRASRRDEMVSTRAALIYKPASNVSAYAGFANSFNPSAEGLSLSNSLIDVDPEKSRTFEVGAKWDAMGGRLSLSTSLFRIEKRNARTPGLDPNDPPQVLAGRERVEGLELSVAGNITRDWSVFTGFALMDSEITASNTPAEIGAALARTPEKTFNLWTTYRLPYGFTLGGGAQYMDSVFRSTTVDERVPSFWLVNAMLAYEASDRVTLRLNATNLADERYIDRVGGGHHIPGATRQFILSAQASF